MIFHCPTKDDVISLWEEAGRPLDEDILLDLAEVDAKLEAEDLSRSFAIIDAQCRVCNYKELIIVPEVADLNNLECTNCESMAMQEREIPDWEQED